MGSFFYEFFLLVNAIHFLFIFLLDIFSINFDNLRFEFLVVLNAIVVHVADVILKRFYVAQIIRLASIQLINFFLHTTPFRH